MALKIRMTRHGAKKRPFYHIVVADGRAPRDGRFIEKLGVYKPQLERDNPQRVTLDAERIKHWLASGAQPSPRVAQFLYAANLGPKPLQNATPIKSAPKAKAQERLKAAAAAAEAAAG